MTRIAMSRAATALFRALIARAGVPRDRILLTDWHSVDWQSLTLVGERHRIALRIIGDRSADAAARLTHGLEDAEFAIPGQIVADIAVVGAPETADDGSTAVRLEALTVAE